MSVTFTTASVSTIDLNTPNSRSNKCLSANEATKTCLLHYYTAEGLQDRITSGRSQIQPVGAGSHSPRSTLHGVVYFNLPYISS